MTTTAKALANVEISRHHDLCKIFHDVSRLGAARPISATDDFTKSGKRCDAH